MPPGFLLPIGKKNGLIHTQYEVFQMCSSCSLSPLHSCCDPNLCDAPNTVVKWHYSQGEISTNSTTMFHSTLYISWPIFMSFSYLFRYSDPLLCKSPFDFKKQYQHTYTVQHTLNGWLVIAGLLIIFWFVYLAEQYSNGKTSNTVCSLKLVPIYCTGQQMVKM